MRIRGLILATVLVAMGAAPSALASTRTFAANSIIIPMDFCYQTTASTTGITGTPAYCIHSTNALNAGEGIFLAYGLVYRLLQNGINVYVITDPAKTKIDDPDMTITAASGTPVTYYKRSNQTLTEFFTGNTAITYRGAPFVIDAGDYTRAIALIQSNAVFTPTFDNVVLHVAKQSFNAPVSIVLSGAPPRIALNNLGGAATSVLTGYLTDAGLNTAGAGGVYPGTQGTIYDEFDNDSDFTGNGLINGGYKILWTPHWTGDAQLNQVTSAIGSFVDAGFALFAECASIEEFETSYKAGGNTVSAAGATTGHFQASAGVWINGITNWPDPKKATQSWVYDDVTNPYVQVGDYKFTSVGGHVHSWKPETSLGSVYKSTLTHLIKSYDSSSATNSNWDIETIVHKDDDPAKGPMIYLGGHSYSGQVAGERLVLNTLLILGQQYVVSESTRSSPIVVADGTTYQGSYLNVSVAQNAYPPVTGHFRQYPPGGLAGTSVTGFSTPASNWDAANGIPVPASRTINTVVSVSGVMTQTAFTTTNVTPIAAAMGIASGAASTAITGIRAGGLGGIDHSIPAIIGPSTVAGSASRPTVAYVGGLDGMLHCIGISGTGVTAGQEVWAFIPPSQLPTIDNYAAGVDGSPMVADVFIDPTNSGIKTWRTVVAVTNGAYGGTVDVIDITNPLTPAWLWTGAKSTGGGAYVMGAATGVAFGMIQGTNGPQSVIYIATKNAGTSPNGFNLYALDAGTGAAVWEWDHAYSRHIPSTATLVPNDPPGIPAGVNTTGDGGLDNWVFFGDLDGKIWAIDATKGTAPSSPIYDAGADGYPINAGVATYRDKTTGHVAVVAATGGKDWVPASYVEYTVAVDTSNSAQLFKTNFVAGERVYAAPTIWGNDVYFITSMGNFAGNIANSVTDAGNLQRVNLTSGSRTVLAAVKKGSSEVDLDTSGNVVAASAAGETQNANASKDATGSALANSARPFTIGAWLDLR